MSVDEPRRIPLLVDVDYRMKCNGGVSHFFQCVVVLFQNLALSVKKYGSHDILFYADMNVF